MSSPSFRVHRLEAGRDLAQAQAGGPSLGLGFQHVEEMHLRALGGEGFDQPTPDARAAAGHDAPSCPPGSDRLALLRASRPRSPLRP